jgi:hypothetical protein
MKSPPRERVVRAFILFSPCSKEPGARSGGGEGEAVRRAKLGSGNDSRAARGWRERVASGRGDARASGAVVVVGKTNLPGVSRTRVGRKGGRPSPHARRQRRCASRSRRLYDDLDALVVASASWGDRARMQGRRRDARPNANPFSTWLHADRDGDKKVRTIAPENGPARNGDAPNPRVRCETNASVASGTPHAARCGVGSGARVELPAPSGGSSQN